MQIDISLKWLAIGFVIISLVIGVLYLCFNTSMFRLAKTIYLISKVSPYEQVIAGAPVILVLGDSTGYGTGAKSKNESIAGLIGRDYPAYTIKNNSKNGRTIEELVEVAENIEGNYELILLQIGGNDILQKREIETVEQELRTIVQELSKHTEHVVMVSSGNVGGAAAFQGETAKEYEQITRSFRSMFLQVAAETPLVYVDLFLEPEVDVIAKNPKRYLAIDGLHPSSEGYSVWYQSLSPVLQKLLEAP